MVLEDDGPLLAFLLLDSLPVEVVASSDMSPSL